jgi:putative glutamine amidotransferase
MKIGVSMEMTRVLRDTWHAAINHEWYEFLDGQDLYPLCCHGTANVNDYDLIILCGGNDMPGIKTWRNNHYPLRDQFEHDLVTNAKKYSVPVVGICRGSHFLNVEGGGTIKLMEQPYDNVKVQLPQFEVTCHHTIQINQLAPGYEILAQDNTGVIELARHTEHRQLQVGWHPERAVNKHTRQYIFEIIKSL